MYIAIVFCVTLFISSKRFWARLHAICLEKALYKLNIIIIIIIISRFDLLSNSTLVFLLAEYI